MSTPRLMPVRSPAPPIHTPWALPDLPVDPAIRWFLVAEGGRFAGASWRRGEVLVCRGDARPGDTVVLVARGHGHPRLGRVEGLRFVGDSGEPCHPARWHSAGPVVAAMRHRLDGWEVDLAVASARERRSRAKRRVGVGQLALPFAA